MNHFCTKKFIQINSFENFHYLNQILSEITTSIVTKNENFDLLFLIIFIANKTAYYNNTTNNIENFLCHELSKNKEFAEINFWKDLLKERVELIAEVEIKQEMEKRKDSIGKEDDTIINVAIGKLGKFGKFLGIGSDNKDLEKEILFNQMFQKSSAKICNNVFEDYLKQFINFNFFLNENNYDKFYFTYKGNKQFKGIDDPKIISLIFSLKYIDIKEIPKFLCLNKDINEKLTKIIYKNILFKFYEKLDYKTHLFIWKKLLKFQEVKNKYNYKKILEEVNKQPNSVKNIDIINLDIIRTSFDTEEETNREKIGNMLKAISKELPSLNYIFND